ncbi:MAG: branched-chain amino acid ABC transporter permease [Candidatus Izemoplasmatales bacterium]|nr:branched-chain amino acid ABC transporter permease [Candidatus Izemoplasmatales bacterium]
MLFDTKPFWQQLSIFVAGAIILYFLLDVFVFRKLPKRSAKRNVTTNVLLVLSLLFLFYELIHTIGLSLFLNVMVNSVINICVLVLATTGIVLIFKTSYTTNFAQGMMATFGAYAAATMIKAWAATSSTVSQPTMVIIGFLVGASVSFILGVLIDTMIIRKAKYVTSVGKQMITMGLVLVFSGAMPLIYGILPLEIPRITYEFTHFTLLGVSLTISNQALIALVTTIVLLAALFSALRFTKWGLGVRATASNETVASMMGVNTRVITAMSWALAGALGGVAAVFLAPGSGQVVISLMVPTQVNGFMAAILGSFSSFAGPIVAAILIPILQNLFVFIVGLWQNALVYLFILLIVLFKPLGLFGKRIAKKV